MSASASVIEQTYLDGGVAALGWQDNAACRGIDTDVFFAEGRPAGTVAAVCGSCPVRDACLDYAVQRPWIAGIWAGTTAAERYRLRVRRRAEQAAGQCRRGHPWTPENTRLRPDGHRCCRACDRARKREYKRNPPPPRAYPRQTHCKHGHEWTAENTVRHPDGHRQCRECKRDRDRRAARKARAS